MGDPYFLRSEVSNSDLSSLKDLLYPRPEFGDKYKAFAFGTLLDAIITEHHKVDYYTLSIDGHGYTYTQEDFDLAIAMKKSALKDSVAKMFIDNADFQSVSIQHNWPIEYNGFEFVLSQGVRCKWDLLIRDWKMGGDIKSTTAETQSQFEAACEHFDYFRSRAWYMDIEGTNKDMLIGISKVNQKVFKISLDRNAPIGTKARNLYEKGKAEYQELAFKYWLFVDGFKTN